MISETQRPRRVGILMLPSFSHLALAAVMEPLRAANRLGGQPHYDWSLLSVDGDAVTSSSGVRVAADADVDGRAYDVVLVVASYDVDRHAGSSVRRFLRDAARRGNLIGGVEAGAYVLALAGLLDGYRATTHWEDLEDFAERFPRINVVPDRFVLDRNRFTTGGALPALDFMLDLLRRDVGLSLSLAVSSTFIYEQEHAAADPQRMVAAGRLAWHDPPLVETIRLMEANIETPLPIAEIATTVGLSMRELQRRFHGKLGRTPGAYYMALRLALGRRMLDHSNRSITDIALACGFASGSAFARAYRAQYMRSPSDQRRLGG